MILVPKELLEKIIEHARMEAPNEVCGWLAGEGNEVGGVYPVPNVAEDPEIRFRMDPEIQLSTMREIRDLGLELTGTYHSHPRIPPAPSARDRGLAAYPEAVHLIISLAAPEPEIRCYRIQEGMCTAVELTVGAVGGAPLSGGSSRERIGVDWSRKGRGVPGLEGAERALRPRRPFEPDLGNAGGGITMSFNRTCRGASRADLVVPLCMPPPAPEPGPKEVGSGETPYIEQPWGGCGPVSI